MIQFPNISPEIFSVTIFGVDVALRWYALSYVVGFLIATFLMRYFTSRGRLWRFNTGPLDRNEVDSLITYLIIAVIIGGRLGYVLFYNLDVYLADPTAIVRVWDGGMAFHGGFLGVVVATILYCRHNGIIVWSCADLIALASGPGILVGRSANFINAELWGRPTGMPWGVIFPGVRAQDCPGVEGECARHPSQLYEAGLEGLFLLLALVVFACWRPGRVLLGAYLFGGISILQLHAQALGIGIPSQVMSMLPYLATILVLVIISRDIAKIKLNAPSSLGRAFHPSR